ncbi:MAG: hypothetical protein DMF86_15640 [Acidobacteria bacterium]|nr:MAG: hypothetical protein DMF86_15640 [Acidobacteriota bacterium]
MRSALAAALLTSIAAAGGQTPQLPALDRGAWGARPVSVGHDGTRWTIAAARTRVTINTSTLAIDVHAGSAQWTTMPSSSRDLFTIEVR